MRTSLRPIVAALTGVAILGSLWPAASASASTAVGPSLPVALAAGLPTGLSLGADRPDLAYGGSSTLTGRLTDPATGSGVAGAQVRLETRSVDGAWVELAGGEGHRFTVPLRTWTRACARRSRAGS